MPIVHTIPQSSSNLPTTKTGFILREENGSTPVYIKSLNRAKMHLAEAGFGPWVQPDAVFITQQEAQFGEAGRTMATCSARSLVAADCLARGTHRLATDEEIKQFHTDQRAREKQCADIQTRTPGNNDPHAAAKLMADAIADSLTSPDRNRRPKEKETN